LASGSSSKLSTVNVAAWTGVGVAAGTMSSATTAAISIERSV